MLYTAGEIDRSLGVDDLIVQEFEKFNALQRHYTTAGEYPEEGLFQEKTSSIFVHQRLKRMGGSAILGGLIIPHGERITIPISQAWERSFPIYYTEVPQGPSKLWTQPNVVAVRKTKQPDEQDHPWRLSGELDYDEIIGIGVGVVAMKGSGLLPETLGGYDISLNLQRTGNDSRVFVSRTIYSQPKQNLTLQETTARHGLPEDEQKDFVQLFREAAWDSVGEPA